MKISHSDYAEHITEVHITESILRRCRQRQIGSKQGKSGRGRLVEEILQRHCWWLVVVVVCRGEVLEKSQTAVVLGAFLHFGIIQIIEIYIHNVTTPPYDIEIFKKAVSASAYLP